MAWLKKRVWQLGIAALLALAGALLMYLVGMDGVDQTLLWVGLVLFFVAMAVPLLSKAFQSAQEKEGEEGEN